VLALQAEVRLSCTGQGKWTFLCTSCLPANPPPGLVIAKLPARLPPYGK
jgi:hypothetical protein